MQLRSITQEEQDLLLELQRRKRRQIDDTLRRQRKRQPSLHMQTQLRFLTKLNNTLNRRPETIKVAYFGDKEKKFFTAVVKVGSELRVGAAKRNTYGPTADDFDFEAGRNQALSRALEAVVY